MVIETVAVIGAGTMGRGIAHTALQHGFDVRIFDVDGEVARAVAEEGARLASESVAGGLHCGNIKVVGSVGAAVKDADAAIEAVVESEAVKGLVLREMVCAARLNCLLATNTSTLSIGRLGAIADCRSGLLGMHFFNPVSKMRLVEVVVVEGTPPRYVRLCTDLVEALGKTPVVVKDSPGFITSRLGLALGNEAMRLVESGVAAPADIDAAMRLGYNHPMGPLELADLVGLDARLNNLSALHPALGDDRYRPPQILIDLVGAGYLGRKSGRGFYWYDENGRRLGAGTGRADAGGSQ